MISQMSQNSTMSRGERNQELFKAYQLEQNEARKLQLRNEIVELNLGLIRRLALKFSSRWQDEKEFFSEGCLALMDAVEKFDPDRGFQFSTYATTCIRNRIYRLFRKRGRGPVMLSLEEESREPFEEVDENDGSVDLDKTKFMTESIIEELSERERELVKLRFGLDRERKFRSYRQVAECVGLSKERVRQLIQKAILQIQSQLVLLPGESQFGN